MAKRQAGHSRPAYHHGDLETALVSAVRGLIERDGVADFSIAEACKQIGVSTAAPYKHFADKHDILRRVARDGFLDLTRAMQAARDSEPSEPVRRIAAIGKSYVHFALANPGAFKLMFGSAQDIKEDETVRQTGHACFDVLISEVGRILGAQDGAEEVRTLSVMLWTFVHGVASLAIDKDYDAAEAGIDTDTLIDTATGRLLAPVPC